MLRLVLISIVLVGGAYAAGVFDSVPTTPSKAPAAASVPSSADDSDKRGLPSAFGLATLNAERNVADLDRCLDLIEEFRKDAPTYLGPKRDLRDALRDPRPSPAQDALDQKLRNAGCPTSSGTKIKDLFAR